jgi:hypothetical protein
MREKNDRLDEATMNPRTQFLRRVSWKSKKYRSRDTDGCRSFVHLPLSIPEELVDGERDDGGAHGDA